MDFKRTIAAAAAAVCVIGAASCGKKNDSSESIKIELGGTTSASTEAASVGEAEKTTASEETTAADTTKESETSETTEKPEATTSTEGTTATSETTEASSAAQTGNGSFSNSDMVFMGNSLFVNAEGLLSKLGQPNDVITAEGCLSNGKDQKVYKFDGLSLYCFMDEDTAFLYEIEITGGSYTTPKGIGVGSSRADVEAAYGAADGDREVIYGSTDFGLFIGYSGDTVVSIDYYAKV